MEYTRFRIYEATYIISIGSAVAIAVICLIPGNKGFMWGKAGEIVGCSDSVVRADG